MRRPKLNRHKLGAGIGAALLIVLSATVVLLMTGAVSLRQLAQVSQQGGSGSTQLPPVFQPDKPLPPGTLKRIKVPLPANLAEFVVDQQAAILLGKALFWDQQAGSDGMACASCHFQAGADNRVKNQLNPGFRIETVQPLGIDRPGPRSRTLDATGAPRPDREDRGERDRPAAESPGATGAPPPAGGRLGASAALLTETFNPTATGGGGPNYTLKKADFPFHRLADPTDRNSTVLFDADDVVSSAGVFQRRFTSLDPAPKRGDEGEAQPWLFNVGGANVRNVEPRNAPTTINAVYNFRNFWDGRANNIFNGRNPFGPRDTSAGVDPLNSILVADGLGSLSPFQVAIPDASLASQAVGPALSDLEMSFAGRTFEQVGQKLLRLQPLVGQRVDPTDSVLGSYANTQGGKDATGLTIGYVELIKRAFQPKFWNSNQLTVEGYTQMEKNFSLFWGLAIMLYEATLVSDDSPFDRYNEGDITAMTPQQVDGFLRIFDGKGGCTFCHSGPEFTNAAGELKFEQSEGGQIEKMIMGDGGAAIYDSGFYNVGVTPSAQDIGTGGTDPWGNPLSWSRQAKIASATGLPTNVGPDQFDVFTCSFAFEPCSAITPGSRDAMDGAFKTPTLRNVELTGPYFHSGGYATLASVIEFYDRGGDHRGTDAANTTGFGANPTNLAPNLMRLGLTPEDEASLLAFLKALTDERVRWERAPFDHPELRIPNGHPGDHNQVLRQGGSIEAVDEFIVLPAVGAAGRAAKGLPPLVPFDEGLQ